MLSRHMKHYHNMKRFVNVSGYPNDKVNHRTKFDGSYRMNIITQHQSLWRAASCHIESEYGPPRK